jgi:hypothetical protein
MSERGVQEELHGMAAAGRCRFRFRDRKIAEIAQRCGILFKGLADIADVIGTVFDPAGQTGNGGILRERADQFDARHRP